MARRSWVQPRKYVYLEPNLTPDSLDRTLAAHLRFVAADGTVQVGVQPSHAGLVAEDWHDIDAGSDKG
ncbi:MULTISPECIES: Thoeris anti-defense Tad2 family protein [Streptomyces]|uniref:DUF2829 domain-containing protein n=1 Tax=Streptomyces brevispora TaxID=887462 RepID=A0ABZ1G5F1_9ACTN|nr:MULTISPECIES: hypothetical protein [Streptomyces]ROQ65241.1 hypothetical protein EDD95_8099 [Streptomyces sp. CEV 2-1]WSC15124.1 DUF2829 domain-containing protein [Streptomyces brevispora]